MTTTPHPLTSSDAGGELGHPQQPLSDLHICIERGLFVLEGDRKNCPACHGHGRVKWYTVDDDDRDTEVLMEQLTADPSHHGKRCPSCGGSGRRRNSGKEET